MDNFNAEIECKIRAIASSIISRKLKELGKTLHDVEPEAYRNALSIVEMRIKSDLRRLESRIVMNTARKKEQTK